MIRESKRKYASNSRVGEKGSVMVEFAFSVVLLLVMVFGVIDFGRAMYTYHFLSNAAREATRWASVNGATCGSDGSCTTGPASAGNVSTYVQRIVPPGVDPTKVITTPTWPGNGTATCNKFPNDPGCPVQVEVSYNFNFLVPIVHNGSITLSSNSEAI